MLPVSATEQYSTPYSSLKRPWFIPKTEALYNAYKVQMWIANMN